MPDSSPSSPRLRIFLLTLLPASITAVLVYGTGVDVPYWDQWVLVQHLQQIAEGTWPWTELWRPHNEHRLFFPQLIMLSLAELTRWDIRVELVLNGLLAFGILASTAWLIRQTLGSRGFWLLPLVSLLIFNPSQWENWLWGWQIQIFLNVFMVVLGTALLIEAQRPGRLIAAMVCGVIATFSFANGLLFWILALPAVARGPGRRRRLPIWIGVSSAVFAIFFFGYEPSQNPPFWQQGPARTLKLLGGYLSIYLSTPVLGFHGHLALYGGFALLVASALILGRDLLREPVEWLLGKRLPWLQLAGYAIGSATLTAVGRLHLSLGQALTSRYITISSLFWLAFLGLFALRESGPPRSAAGRRTLVAMLVTLLVIHGTYGAIRMEATGRERAEARRALLKDPTNPAALSVLYPDPQLAGTWALTLERLRLGPYRDR